MLWLGVVRDGLGRGGRVWVGRRVTDRGGG